MTTVRVAIVGSGGMARRHAETFSNLEGAALVAIASRNRDTGAALAGEHRVEYVAEWERLVERRDLDAISICTHNDTHGRIAIAALEHDKHVLTEYPLARTIEEGETAVRLAASKGLVLRATHSEVVSRQHAAIRRAVEESGSLILASFLRLTPGRGARPDVLFNIPVSGPPAHFFIYHLYPVIDLFGPVAWVEGAAEYDGLRDDGRYRRFANTVSAGFRRGGIAQWTWAGGIEIHAAEQEQRYVLTGATIRNGRDGWELSTVAQTQPIEPLDGPSLSIYETWIEEVRQGDRTAAHADAETALEAIRVSLSAERSMNENRRILLD